MLVATALVRDAPRERAAPLSGSSRGWRGVGAALEKVVGLLLRRGVAL